ncbi:MAG: hypothetical protein BWK79_07400 [Beggiatoa sp. IS2]|nr:MAG: hypothetical protein BWK79_07400 [Beggiatoa sp. IS2]
MPNTLKLSTTLADRVIFLAAITLVVWLYTHYWTSSTSPADYALIRVAQQPPQRVNLQGHQYLHIQGHLGESTLEIDNGRIRFLNSPCQNKLCIHSGWLQKAGDFSVCLPNQVSIQLQGTETSRFDAIVH